MNRPQRIVLAFAAVIIGAMVLFPPWLFVFNPSADWAEDYRRQTRPAGYHFLFSSPVPEDRTELIRIFNLPPISGVAGSDTLHQLSHFTVVIDKDRFMLQLAGALIITLLLGLMFKTHKKEII